MGQLRIYISCPISIPYEQLQRTAKNVQEGHPDAIVKYWNRQDKYAQHIFDEADLILFMLPCNRFEMNVCDLPIGQKSEIRRADTKGIKIGLIYTTVSGQIGVYEIESDAFMYKDILKGKPGSAGNYRRMHSTRHDVLSPVETRKEMINRVINRSEGVKTIEKISLPTEGSYKIKSYIGTFTFNEEPDRRLLLV